MKLRPVSQKYLKPKLESTSVPQHRYSWIASSRSGRWRVDLKSGDTEKINHVVFNKIYSTDPNSASITKRRPGISSPIRLISITMLGSWEIFHGWCSINRESQPYHNVDLSMQCHTYPLEEDVGVVVDFKWMCCWLVIELSSWFVGDAPTPCRWRWCRLLFGGINGLKKNLVLN